jgi:uncharacterized membrane protein
VSQDTSSGITDQDKLMAALSYIIGLIVPLIILFTEAKNRPFQKYHAVQSLGLDVALMLVWIVLCVLGLIIAMIPVLQIVSCLMPFLYLLLLIPLIYYAYRAYKGEMFEIPVVTPFLRQQKWL